MKFIWIKKLKSVTPSIVPCHCQDRSYSYALQAHKNHQFAGLWRKRNSIQMGFKACLYKTLSSPETRQKLQLCNLPPAIINLILYHVHSLPNNQKAILFLSFTQIPLLHWHCWWQTSSCKSSFPFHFVIFIVLFFDEFILVIVFLFPYG